MILRSHKHKVKVLPEYTLDGYTVSSVNEVRLQPNSWEKFWKSGGTLVEYEVIISHNGTRIASYKIDTDKGEIIEAKRRSRTSFDFDNTGGEHTDHAKQSYDDDIYNRIKNKYIKLEIRTSKQIRTV
jgi:hypothetical protein